MEKDFYTRDYMRYFPKKLFPQEKLTFFTPQPTYDFNTGFLPIRYFLKFWNKFVLYGFNSNQSNRWIVTYRIRLLQHQSRTIPISVLLCFPTTLKYFQPISSCPCAHYCPMIGQFEMCATAAPPVQKFYNINRSEHNCSIHNYFWIVIYINW